MVDDVRYRRILEFVLVIGLAIVFLAILMVLSGSNAKADIIVDQAGGGNYLTIQEGIDNAIPGENVFVWDGSYNENITIDKNLQLIGNGSATTKIDGFGTMNNIINITAEGVVITGFNITESGMWYGIWANVGGFNVHDNLFDTQNHAVYMDIYEFNVGSITVGDVIIENNTVIGTVGFHLDAEFEQPSPGSDIIFGNTRIINNIIQFSTSTAIEIYEYYVYDMDGGSITWGDIIINGNTINSTTVSGIDTWCGIGNCTDVVINVGMVEASLNTVTASQRGVRIDWWDFWEFHGTTTATTGDVYIEGNTVNSVDNGLYLQPDAMGQYFYDTSSLTTGNFYVTSNNIINTRLTQEGIFIRIGYNGQHMYNDSSLTIENLYIENNTVVSNYHGIGIHASYNGNYMNDNALYTLGNIHVKDNNISSAGNGIHIECDQLGYDMHDNASFTMGYFTMISNNITSVGQGINIQGKNIARTMHNDTIFSMGDFTTNNNVIDSTSSIGINFGISSSAYTMTGNATAAFGNFLFTNNNITSATDGINLLVDQTAYNMFNDTKFSMGNIHMNPNLIDSAGRGISLIVQNSAYNMYGASSVMFGDFKLVGNNITSVDICVKYQWDTVGYNMNDNTYVFLGESHVDWNILDKTSGVGYAIDSYPADVGTQMYGDSFLTYGNWYVDNNNITSSGGGIYTGHEYCGYEMWDNSQVTFSDYFIRDNTIKADFGMGLDIGYYDCGEFMWDHTLVTGGNFLVSGNNASSSSNYGYYLYYNYMGYDMYDDTYASFGWVETSNNNFSSNTNYGAYIYIYCLGAYMYGNSQAYIGDIIITDNELWSTNSDGLYYSEFYENAYYMYNYSYVRIGDVLVNDNYINAGGNGIYLDDWTENAYFLYQHANADFGNFEFNRNIIEAGANGIYANNIQYWADYLYWNNHVTTGHWQYNDNNINASGETGISIFYFYDIGSYMYGTSTLTMGNLEVLRNTINATGGVGMDVSVGRLAYFNYGSSQCYFGDFLFNNNIVNASGDGIYISAIQDSASYMYNDSYVHFGNFEVNNNDITAGYNPLPGYDGIYVYFYDNGYRMYDNSEAYFFGHMQINNNTITCHDDEGIYLDVFTELGASMYDNSYFEMGNLEVCGNWIDVNGAGMYIPWLAMLGYDIYDNSTAVFGDFLFDGNTIYAGADGVYIDAYNWAYTMTGTTRATFGDLSVSNNIIESRNQGIYFQFENAGYDMHDMSTFEMGSIMVLNNTIISGQDPASVTSYGILFRSRYVGFEMYNESQAIVGPILVNENTVTVIFGTNADGIYINWISDYGAYMYDTATFTMNGNIEVCRNTVNTTNGDNGIFCDVYNLGTYLFGDNIASYGNILFNDNIIVDAYNDGMQILVNAIGYYTYGNSSVTIGNVELSNNDIQIEDGSYYSSIDLDLYDLGASMYDGSIFNMGHFQMNDNTITNPDGMGLYIEAYRLGYQMYNSANANFGNFEFLRNNITSYDEGITLSYLQNFMANMYNNTSAFFGDFLINDNIINTTSLGGDGIYFDHIQYLGYQMSDQSYAEFGNFEVCGNKIHAQPLAYGIYIWPEYWAYDMYDNAAFIMGDWLINNNIVISDLEAIYFYSTSFGNNMYGNSSAYFGKNEIMYNTVNSTGGDGIEAWWWYDFGSWMYDYSHFEAGDCYIMFNNITSTSSTHYGLETGPQDTGYYVRDEAEAYFGDYIISNNVIYSEGTEGIDLWYYEVGWWLDNTNLPECWAVVDVGMVIVTDNNITVPNGEGICVYGYYVASFANDYSNVTTGGIHIRRNTINSFGHGIDIYMEEFGEDTGNNAQIRYGSLVLDENEINATNGNGIYIYSIYFAYSTHDSAFVSMDDIFITNNDIVAGITGIEFTCDWWIELYTSSEARAPGLWVTGNNVSAPVSAFNYTTLNTPTRIDPGTTFSTGNVTISDNIFDGGLFGVMIDWQKPVPSGEGQPDFYLENNSIENGAANSIGLYMMNIQNATIESLYLDSYEQGIYVSSSNIWFMFNSTLSNIPSYDLNLSAGSFIGAVNTTFDNASVYFEDDICLLNVGWFMNVYVQSQVSLPVPEANVTVKDVDGTEVFNSTANLDGRAFYIICWEYQENITGIIKNFNDYTADANKAGSFGSAVPNPTMNQTRLVVITLTDLIPPTIFSDGSDTAGTTGDPFYFEINATDNMGIVSVHVNYRFEGVGPYTNLTMSGTGPYWLNEIMPSDYVGFIEYYFTAVDSGGFWVNTTPTTAPITDNDAPTIISDNSDTFATTGETFNFIVDATDNIEMSEVHVVWWFGAGAPTNDTMTGIGPYTYSIPVPLNSIDQLHYYFTMNDTVGNWLIGPQVDINVTDNDPPTFIWISQPSAGTTGESVLISLLATDNIDITYYKIDVDGVLYDLIKDGDYYNFTINIPPDSIAPIPYSIIFNDSANNPNIITPPMITVTDNDQPTYSWVSQPTSGTTGESVLVSILAIDNIGITYYKIDIDGNLYDLIKDGDYYNYTINIPFDSAAAIPYSLILNDSAGNPNIISPPMITITDNDQPTYSWVSQPFSGTTGESVPVSILALDNIGITYYKIEIDGILYDLIKDGDYYNYTLNIPVDSLTDITYILIFNDSANNPNSTASTVITVTDNDAPTFTWVSRPTAGVAGTSVLVSLTASDNIGITNYTIYVDGIPFDMVKYGDYYNYTIDIPPGTPVDIIYNVTLGDAEGHLVETGDNIIDVISVDDEAPQYSWILHPAAGTTGDSVLVSLLATDNIGINYYKIEIDGTLYDLIKDGDYYNYTINIPSDSLASRTYSVTFNDAADNPVSTPDTTITVTDNDAPAFTWVLHPSTGTAGGSVLVSVMASDNIGITYYKIDIDGTLYDLIKVGNYFNYTINIPPGSSDSITYDIIFKDAADNEISTGDTVITVIIPTDTEAPEFTWVLHPEAGTTGDSLLVSVTATDNIGITYYKISVGGILHDLVKNGNYYNYTINVPTDSLASITYFVVFNDSANNPNTATSTVITVTDNDPATISNPASDTSGKKGKEFRFQIDASDNIGISEVKVWYWFGDDESLKKSLTLTGENNTYSGSITPEESGNLHYYFEITDSAGNSYQSDEYSVAIGAAEKEGEEELNVFPFIILVIIIIIVILLFLLTRKKKEVGEIPEAEEGLAEGEEEIEEIEAEEGEGEELEEGIEGEPEEEEIESENLEGEEVELEDIEPDEELDLEEEAEDKEL